MDTNWSGLEHGLYSKQRWPTYDVEEREKSIKHKAICTTMIHVPLAAHHMPWT